MIKKFNSYLIKENIDLNEIESLKIFYNTPEEAVAISEILMNLGYKVYDEIGNLKKESNDWDCFVYEDDMFTLAKKSYIKSKFKEISYIDFINKYWNKKFKKIENPDLDPYGEEDWGWEEIKENIDLNEIENLKIFYNTLEEAVAISEILMNFGYKVYDFESVKKDANDWQCFIFYDHEFCLAKASFNLRTQKYKEISYIDFINKYGNKKIKKIENPDLDPYGEEDWGWEEIKENKKNNFEIGDVVIHTTLPKFGKGLVVHIERNNVFINFENETGTRVVYPNCQYNHGWHTDNGHSFLFNFIEKRNIKFKKIENPELDPYGEEDWGYEEIKENNKYNDLRGKTIFIQNQFEYDELMKYLESLGGYLWTAGQNPTGYDYQISRPRCLIVTNSGRLRLIEDQAETIKASDILKFKLKKFKKIEHPELDPYGEEDWGWEEIKENELKKYNELFFGGGDMRDVTKSLNRELKWGERDIRGESFFIKDLQKSIFGRKRLIDELKDKLIGKRVAFFYDRDRGIDGTERRKEIMTIKDVLNNSYRTILFIGTPETGRERSLVIREDYPITILPEQKRVFNDVDPYGEEDWGDEN